MDGKRVDSATNKMKGHVIPQGGTVVFGQDQDKMGDKFQTSDAFGPGQLTELNLWSKVLSQEEIAAQYQDCDIPQGSVHAWPQFKDTTDGDAQAKDHVCEIDDLEGKEYFRDLITVQCATNAD